MKRFRDWVLSWAFVRKAREAYAKEQVADALEKNWAEFYGEVMTTIIDRERTNRTSFIGTYPASRPVVNIRMLPPTALQMYTPSIHDPQYTETTFTPKVLWGVMKEYRDPELLVRQTTFVKSQIARGLADALIAENLVHFELRNEGPEIIMEGKINIYKAD